MVDELAEAGMKPGAVVASVGGGGLLCGVIMGLQRHGWDDVRVVAAETDGVSSLVAGARTPPFDRAAVRGGDAVLVAAVGTSAV